MSAGWTNIDEIAARVRRRWDDGSLLRAYANGYAFDPIDVRLRGPKPSQVGDDVAAARDWVAALDAGRREDSRYTLQWQSIGGRQIGRNQVPVRAVVSSIEQAGALLGVTAAVRRFDELLGLAHRHPQVRQWVVDHPLRALELAAEMPQLISAYTWLDGHRQSHRYLREISAPGVDTKFAERHRPVLAAMLGVPATASGFLAALGLRSKPGLVRLRPARSLGLPHPLTELAARSDELAQLRVEPTDGGNRRKRDQLSEHRYPRRWRRDLGEGLRSRQRRSAAMAGRRPTSIYWGDIDTHGFAILDRLRAWLPRARSVLMDRETLLAHRDRWVSEDRPARSTLTRLTHDEHDLYVELVEDGFG